MTWKDRLRAFRCRTEEARQILEQLEEMESRIYEPRAQRFSATPHASAGGHTMDDLVDAHIRLQDKYRRRLADIERKQARIEDAMDVLSSTQRMIIRYYYFDVKSWSEVCPLIHYSWSQTHRIHAEALRILDTAYPTDKE